MRKYLVVGVDPGTTTGLAILGLEGEVLVIDSWRDISLSDLVEEILDVGNPIMLSTDVSPAPNSVLDLSTRLDAELWKPDKSLSQDEKRKLTKDFETDNSHEMDALAASLKSFRFLKSKLENIKNRSPSDLSNRDLIKLVIEGKSLKEAIEVLREEREIEEDIKDDVNEKRKRKGLEKKIKNLQGKVNELNTKNEKKDKKIRELKEEISRIKSRKFLNILKSSEIKSRERKIKSLKKELSEKEEKLEELSDLVSVSDRIRSFRKKDDKLVLKKLPSFTKEEIIDLENTLGVVEGDLLFIEDASGGGGRTAEMIAEKVRAVIVTNELSHPAKEKLIQKDIPFISSSELEFRDFDKFVVIDKDELEDIIEEKKLEFEDIKKERIKSRLDDLEGF